ncbi:MAG: RHS repeat-associated core domain-containing protein, partial [Pyrinomonadaceae bacterium]
TNTSFSSRYQFTGREYDSFSSLQYSRARFYDPNLGRFISEDPVGFEAGDFNLYA